MLRAFDTLKGWQVHPDYWMFRNWVGVDHAMARDTFRTLGRERLKKIAKLFFADPYAFQKGWPDLACIDGERLRLIEVKTSDRLQIFSTHYDPGDGGDCAVERRGGSSPPPPREKVAIHAAAHHVVRAD